MRRRRRGLGLLCLAVALGGLALAQVRGQTAATEAQVGSPIPVVVTERDLPAGTRLGRGDAGLTVREVPETFVPSDSFAAVEELRDARLGSPAPAGAYITAAHLEPSAREEGTGVLAARPGERFVRVAVAAPGEPAPLAPGDRVDVVVTTDPGAGGSGRSYVAIESVELVDLERSSGEATETGTPEAVASLRVRARQAVLLIAAANFGRELRLLSRPAGDGARIGPSTVSGDEL